MFSKSPPDLGGVLIKQRAHPDGEERVARCRADARVLVARRRTSRVDIDRLASTRDDHLRLEHVFPRSAFDEDDILVIERDGDGAVLVDAELLEARTIDHLLDLRGEGL